MAETANVEFLGDSEPDEIGTPKPEVGTEEQHGTPKSDSGLLTVDPFTISQPAQPGPGTGPGIGDTKPRRGRPPGSRNRNTPTETPKVSQDLGVSIEDLLISVHEMAAAFFHADELSLDKEEALQGAKHLNKISKLYNHNINPAVLVWSAFVMWILTVYGTRGVAIYKRITSETTKKGPQLVPPKPATPNAPPPTPADLSQLAPSQLWNEPPQDE